MNRLKSANDNDDVAMNTNVHDDDNNNPYLPPYFYQQLLVLWLPLNKTNNNNNSNNNNCHLINSNEVFLINRNEKTLWVGTLKEIEIFEPEIAEGVRGIIYRGMLFLNIAGGFKFSFALDRKQVVIEETTAMLRWRNWEVTIAKVIIQDLSSAKSECLVESRSSHCRLAWCELVPRIPCQRVVREAIVVWRDAAKERSRQLAAHAEMELANCWSTGGVVQIVVPSLCVAIDQRSDFEQ